MTIVVPSRKVQCQVYSLKEGSVLGNQVPFVTLKTVRENCVWSTATVLEVVGCVCGMRCVSLTVLQYK